MGQLSINTMSGPFHSEMEAPGGNTIGNMALLPLRQTVKNAGRGFAPETQDEDIVDETIRLFKPNILFKSFEMKDTMDILTAITTRRSSLNKETRLWVIKQQR